MIGTSCTSTVMSGQLWADCGQGLLGQQQLQLLRFEPMQERPSSGNGGQDQFVSIQLATAKGTKAGCGHQAFGCKALVSYRLVLAYHWLPKQGYQSRPAWADTGVDRCGLQLQHYQGGTGDRKQKIQGSLDSRSDTHLLPVFVERKCIHILNDKRVYISKKIDAST